MCKPESKFIGMYFSEGIKWVVHMKSLSLILSSLLHYKIFKGCNEPTYCKEYVANFHAYLSSDLTFWVGDTEIKLQEQVMQIVSSVGRLISCR
jgi:hypothetical protein